MVDDIDEGTFINYLTFGEAVLAGLMEKNILDSVFTDNVTSNKFLRLPLKHTVSFMKVK